MGDAYACNVGFSALYFDHFIIYGSQRMMTKGVMQVRDLHEQAEIGQILVLTCPSGSPKTLTAGTRPLPKEVYTYPDPLPSLRPKKP